MLWRTCSNQLLSREEKNGTIYKMKILYLLVNIISLYLMMIQSYVKEIKQKIQQHLRTVLITIRKLQSAKSHDKNWICAWIIDTLNGFFAFQTQFIMLGIPLPINKWKIKTNWINRLIKNFSHFSDYHIGLNK